VFGTSELAVATVLAAYMGGLGAGAAVAGRYLDRVKRPVLVYGALEAGIAVSALCVPLLLRLSGWAYAAMLGGQPEPPDSGGLLQPLYYSAASFLILALPTGMMGATLPLLTRYAVQKNRQVGPRVALLYGINTFGAVVGTLAAGFFLLPAFGLQRTVIAGVVANAAVFGIAAWLARRTPESRPEPGDSGPGAAARSARWSVGSPSWILPIMLVSGAVAFLYEILWTRMLTHVLGGTVYAFATMLASFLTGIALGGSLAGRFAVRRATAGTAFASCQVAVAVLSAVIYTLLQGLEPGTSGLGENVLWAIVVLLPATVFIGATFPIAVRILAAGAEDAGRSTARTYAWNTVGAIAGSVLAGFFLVPALGFEGAVRLAVGANLLLAVSTLVLVGEVRRVLAVTVAASGALAVFVYEPQRPYGLLDTSLDAGSRGGTPLHYAVGRSATVVLKRHDGNFYLRTNGLPEAFIQPRGAPPRRRGQTWLTALPVVARPDAESMLVVGYGGGVAIEGVPESVSTIDVVELEPEVMAANRVIAGSRRYDPLSDERVRVILNDARNALTLTAKTYDVIVSQPSHPWTAGASHLYTREFLTLVKRHLAPSGVYVQWLNSTFVDAELLRTLSATLLDRFANVRLYQPDVTFLLFLASDGRLDVERQVAHTGRPFRDSEAHYARLGLNSVEDLLVALTLDEAGIERLAGNAPLNTDDDNRLALFSRFASDGLDGDGLHRLFEDIDPLVTAGSWIHGELSGSTNLSYVGNRLILGFQTLRAARLAEAVTDRSTSLTIRGLGLRSQGLLSEAEDYLRRAVAADPENQQARYALIQPYLGNLAQGDAPDEIARVARGLRGPAVAVAAGWTHGVRRDWQALSALDAELGRTRSTDLWYAEAVKLRADWRIQGTARRPVNLAARQMIDRALLIARAAELLVIRSGAAIRLQDPEAFVETAQLVQLLMVNKLDRVDAGDYSLSARELATLRGQVGGYRQQLDSAFVEPVAARAAEVKNGFGRLAERLQRLGGSGGKP
jgi:spermidine synthase